MGFIRYQTVRNIGLGAVGAGAVAGIVALASGGSKTDVAARAPAPPAPPVQVTSAPTPTGPPPAPPVTPPQPLVAAGSGALDDAAIARRADQPATPGEKVKDAFQSNPVKVNLYEETQDGRYDRLKVDRNRDDQWDEQWTRAADGNWQKEDGSVLVAGQWVTAGAPSPSPSPSPSPTPAPTANEPYAAELSAVAMEMVSGHATAPKLKDLFRGRGPKVNLYDDDKDGRWDRAKVDYDRDEVDDAKLTMKAGVLERHDEKTGAVMTWSDNAWKAKP